MMREGIHATLDAIEAIDSASGPKQIVGFTAGSLLRYGITAFVDAYLPNPDLSPSPEILLNGWPPEWYERYVGEHFYKDDPIVRHCLASTVPFAWSEIPAERFRSARARETRMAAAEFRLTDGFCVPIHGPQGGAGVLTAGHHLDLSAASRRAIHIIAIYAHTAAERGRFYPGQTPRALSDRERDVLSLVAHGRTIQDVSEDLTLSEHTVVQHLRNIRRKLKTRNTVHSVAEALRRREIMY
jgi:LuxR family transcriptional regulator, quorum-sensing system regulator BjaR1